MWAFRQVIKWRFVSRVSDQMTALMAGVNEFIPQNLLSIFDAHELEVLRLRLNFAASDPIRFGFAFSC